MLVLFHDMKSGHADVQLYPLGWPLHHGRYRQKSAGGGWLSMLRLTGLLTMRVRCIASSSPISTATRSMNTDLRRLPPRSSI
jgi:hypothetical protein